MNTESIMLETERLLIKPLSYHELLLYVKPGNSLEQSLELNAYPRILPGELKEALEQTILPQVSASNNHLFCTLWTIIHKEKKLMVGDLCFKGAPNTNAEIEIGYGTYNDFQKNGFMTEALGIITCWALNQQGIQAIIAETDKDNIASQITLLKNHFKVYRKLGNMIWWRLEK